LRSTEPAGMGDVGGRGATGSRCGRMWKKRSPNLPPETSVVRAVLGARGYRCPATPSRGVPPSVEGLRHPPSASEVVSIGDRRGTRQPH
jgi:hypothetical protein